MTYSEKSIESYMYDFKIYSVAMELKLAKDLVLKIISRRIRDTICFVVLCICCPSICTGVGASACVCV